MRAHFLQYIFLFFLVHNSDFLKKTSRIIVPDHILMWSSAQWVKSCFFWASIAGKKVMEHPAKRVIYCKRCYFRVTKFSRLAAQKHIRGLLNSR